MKKKCLILALFVVLAVGCSFRKNPAVEVDFDWQKSSELNQYLRDSVWTFNDGEELVFIYVKGNFELIKTVQKDSLQNLGSCSKLKTYSCAYHEMDNYGVLGDYPYLKIGDKIYDFIEIKEDSFTLAGYNNGNPCTFTKKEKVKEVKTGKYQINGKTYTLYLSEYSGSIRHEETGKGYEIKILDSNRIRIEGTILSDIPIYRWWEDEEGNLILLSEGYEVSGLSNEEIFQTFPVIKLEKID